MARKIVFLSLLILFLLTPLHESAADQFRTDLGDFNGVAAYSNGSIPEIPCMMIWSYDINVVTGHFLLDTGLLRFNIQSDFTNGQF